MGLWGRHLLPRVINACHNSPHVQQIRERMCAGLTGEVVEIGFGSGLNAPYYPAAVSRVLAVEPSDVGWGLAAGRIADSRVPVERIGPDGQALPLADHSVDSALSTWTLCTIPDPDTAMAELRRVLKPGGRLTFIEHGLSPDTGVATWQRRMDPLQRRIVGGCRLTLPVLRVIEGAGFVVEQIENEYEEGAPQAIGYLYEGTALTPA
jgi:ubiquinone/menaquinone biosynthesis C-methylase UbiE